MKAARGGFRREALVGVTAQQIRWIAFEEPKKQLMFVDPVVRRGVATAIEKRAGIRALALSDDTQEKRRLLEESESAVALARALGDALVAGFFAETKESARKKRLTALRDSFAMLGEERALRKAAEDAREGLALRPFHWEIEFPEVFARENPGFDAVVGNPPFMGGVRISEIAGATYLEWLQNLHFGAGGATDLSAHFFRRSFVCLRKAGASGLIATNTIAQGESRSSGLRWIRSHGGNIYCAFRRVKWPGLAAVTVSVVHVGRGLQARQKLLDDLAVDDITAYLFHQGGDDDPHTLKENAETSYQGSIVLGMGFTFDERDRSKNTAGTFADLDALLAKNPTCKERVFPYLGGEDINDHPEQAHSRYVINFGEMTEVEARRWPHLMSILEAKVRPERQQKDASKYPRMVNEWWKFWNSRPELTSRLDRLRTCFVHARHSKHLSFVQVNSRSVFSEALNVFTTERMGFFSIVQSFTHEVWARFFASTLEDRLRYTPSDCFETFPFPRGWETDAALEYIGKRYHDRRAEIMKARWEGLTKTYNRFHDPQCTDDDIEELRALHAEMDRAVLAAYGWTDLDLTTDFHPEHADEPDGKKRLRWSDGTRDAVLGRLLALNAERAAEERGG